VVFISYILKCFESGCQVDAMINDFEKAFEKVDQGWLIAERKRLVNGNPLLF